MHLAKFICIALLTLLVACGDSTSNNNGTSFTFFGWFQDAEGTVGTSTGRLSLDGLSNQIVYAGLQNNLSGQFIILDRIQHSYQVPGARISIPSTSVGAAGVARPPALDDGEVNLGNGLSTLPNNAFTDAGAIYAGTFLVTEQLVEFLSLNRESLPEAPYSLIITSIASGTTSSGGRIDSNPIQFEIVVQPDVFVELAADAGDPAAGDGAGDAAGGEAAAVAAAGDDSDVIFF